ncbi:hypothetical protein LINGRAHAP2_LOCUS29253 [Linum grandiflorum]
MLLGAIHSIHSCGITYRDIKSDNILVFLAELKVVDFGMAMDSWKISPTSRDFRRTMRYLLVPPNYLHRHNLLHRKIGYIFNQLSSQPIEFNWSPPLSTIKGSPFHPIDHTIIISYRLSVCYFISSLRVKLREFFQLLGR